MPVDGLKEDEALELLERLRPFANDAERNATKEIIRLFGGHAFRVEKIGAYLRVNADETYKGFLEKTQVKTQERIKRLSEKIDSKDFKLRHEAICDEECLSPTLKALTRNARTLLNWAALFGPDSVAVPWVGELAEIDDSSLRKALLELEDYRLLIPAVMDSKEETSRLFDANVARLHRIAREIVIARMRKNVRCQRLKQVGVKIDTLLSKGAFYWLAGGAAWGLDSITDFCFDRYLEVKKEESSEKDYHLIRWFHKLFDLYLNHLRSFERVRETGLASQKLSLRLVGTTPDDPVALRALSLSYGRLGDLSVIEGSRREARDYYEKSLELDEKLVSHALTIFKRCAT
jgi:hypothetical protein